MQLHLLSSSQLPCQSACSCIKSHGRSDSSVTERPSKQVVLAWARLLKAERLPLAHGEAALNQAGMAPPAWVDTPSAAQGGGPAPACLVRHPARARTGERDWPAAVRA